MFYAPFDKPPVGSTQEAVAILLDAHLYSPSGGVIFSGNIIHALCIGKPAYWRKEVRMALRLAGIFVGNSDSGSLNEKVLFLCFLAQLDEETLLAIIEDLAEGLASPLIVSATAR
jgi:hypothetical protein